ncbi:NAD(P)/FAD-dependent oxidoreductase [Bradyrhizobium diversitatis]|uniref:Tryptophan 7-halogenase n=1 Tax=Bradyrhizobium diversitatis TaxID=2755406 RepID=A0ABS0PB38_9BRAD|nr:FAD-dependent monooxygenase [Bradyrhizobium diversitatis]MBH5390521.1 tryptophan 7-halogenase [Bradyrhizobium diversitatis]
MATFDFAVVGGGPAGLAAAALLARGGAGVLLVDAARARGPRAGEFIHPSVRSFVHRLALLPERWEEAHLPVHGFVNGWASAISQETDFIFHPNGYALALDRRRFEGQLLEAAVGCRADTRMGWIARAIEPCSDEQWRITLGNGEDVRHCEARYLLLATGRQSFHPRVNFRRRRYDRLAFLAVHIPRVSKDNRPFIECFENGWVYVTPVPSDASVIYVFFDARMGPPCRRTVGSLRQTLACCDRLSTLFSDVSGDRNEDVKWFAGTAHSGLATPTAGKNWCLLGDVAESRDPLSASGMYSALQDASRVSERLLRDDFTTTAREDMDASRQQSFAEYLKMREGYYAAETRWSDLPFWVDKGGSMVEASAIPALG